IAAFRRVLFLGTNNSTATFSGNLTLGTLTTVAKAYSISISGSNNTIATNTSFANTGTLTLGKAGGTTNFSDGVTISSPSALYLLGTINSSNGVAISSPITLNADSTLTNDTSSNINISSTINSAVDGSFSLAIDSGTFPVTLANTVGIQDSKKLSTLTINGGGAITIYQSISTSGIQTYTDAVTLFENATTKTLTGSTITFSSTLDGEESLKIVGNAVFTAAVGGGGAGDDLTSLWVTGTSSINSNITTVDEQRYDDQVTLTAGPITLTTTSGNDYITFNSIITGAFNLILENSTSAVNFNATSGTTSSIALLDINGTGITSIKNNITTTLTQDYGGPVTLTGNSILTATTITFSDIIGGAYTLKIIDSVNAIFNGEIGGVAGANPLTSLEITGNSTLTANVTTTGSQTYSGAVTSISDLIFTTSSGTIYIGDNIFTTATQTYNGPVLLTSSPATAINLTGTTVTFDSTLSSSGVSRALTITGNASFNGAIGGGTYPLSSLTITANSTLTNNISIVTNNGNISFGGSVSGAAFTLSIDAGTNNNTVTFSGNVTLGTLTTAAKAYAISLTGATTNITNQVNFLNTGTLTLANTFNLTNGLNVSGPSSTTLSANTAINTVDAAISFTAAVSGAAQTLSIDLGTNNSTVTFSGNLTLNTLTTVAKAYSILFYGSNNTITTNTTFNNTGSLTLGNGGAGVDNFTFSNGFSSTSPSTNYLSATINATAGNISFTNATILNGATIITTSVGSGSTTFSSTLNSNGVSNYALTINNGAGSVFLNNIIGTIPALALASLNISGAGTTSIANDITTTGNQTYTGASLITDNGVMLTSSAGGVINFKDKLNSSVANRTLTISGNADFDGIVGGDLALDSLLVSGTTNIGANITSISTQTYNSAVTLTAGPIVLATTDSDISFATTASTLNGGYNLTLTTGNGDIYFNGVVGGVTPLTSITITNSTTSTNIGNNITTSLNQIYNGPVLLTNTASTSTITSTAGNINFIDTINNAGGAANGNLSIVATAGTIDIDGLVGGILALTSLSLSGISAISVNINTSGSQSYAGTVILDPAGASLTFNSSNNGNISFTSTSSITSTVDGAKTLNINCGSGNISFAGTVGIGTKLTSIAVTSSGNLTFSGSFNIDTLDLSNFSTNSGTLTIGSSSSSTATITNGLLATNASEVFLSGNLISTSGDITLPATTLNANTSIDTSASNSNINFTSTLNGARTLNISPGSGTLNFSSEVGGLVKLTSITINGSNSTINIANNISTTSNQSYAGAVLLTGSSTIRGRTIYFTNTLSSYGTNHPLTIEGDVDFDNSIGGAGGGGGSSPLSSLTIYGTSAFGTSEITTIGTQKYFGAVTLNLTDPTLTLTSTNNGAIIFGSSLNGAKALNISNGTADTTFTGAVGTSTPLTTINFTSSGNISFMSDLNVASINLSNYTSTTSTAATGISFAGDTTISNSFLHPSNRYNLSFTGSNTYFGSMITFANSGTLTLGDNANDTFTFTGALTATSPSLINLAGTINVSDAVNLGNTLLKANTIINAGENTSNSNITFNGKVNGAYSLSLNSKTSGDITFNADIGSDIPLSSLYITSANHVSNNAKIIVDYFTQKDGYGLTSLGLSTLISNGNVYIKTYSLTGSIIAKSLTLLLEYSCDITGSIGGYSDIGAFRFTTLLNPITTGSFFLNGYDLSLAMVGVDNIVSANVTPSILDISNDFFLASDTLNKSNFNSIIGCQHLSWVCDSFYDKEI
ncbi:MAG: hypothetical protein HQK49_17470, partial [Oligoflexia bacterium]|nr:hypothetical protein [Oligoflexia bacterium]